jgi:replicative DNA helicase
MKPRAEGEIVRPLPHNDHFERTVLAMLMVGNKQANEALDSLRPEDFFDSRHQHLYRKIAELVSAKKPTDLLTLHDELGRSGALEQVGGIGYLASIADQVPQAGNLLHFARAIKDKAWRRGVIHAAAQIQNAAFEGAEPAETVLDKGIEWLSELARDAEAERDEGASFRDAASRLLQSFDAGNAVRIFTDVEELDAVTGGFRAGELVLFPAETGTGKTLLAQQTRRRACRDGHHSLFCSGEMHAPHLVSREVASAARIPPWKMRRPERITRDEMRALVEAAAQECSQCRILDGELSLGRIRRAARGMAARTGLGLVVLDYDELIEAPGDDEFDQQRALARGAKSLAIELSCPVILVSQLRKPLGGEDARRPTLGRLYGSAAKSKHASIVVYVDREFVRELKGDETAARIVVLKNRDGRVGRIEAKFNIETLRFESVPKTTAEQPAQAKDHKAAAAGEPR